MNIDQDKSDAKLPGIFSRDVRYAPNEGSVRFLNHLDHWLAHAYVLSNCVLVGEYEWYVPIVHMEQNLYRLNRTTLCSTYIV